MNSHSKQPYLKLQADQVPTEIPILVSVITIVYQGVKYIEKTIESVIYQDYDWIEYIIIDGGSTDGTIDLIKSYQDKINYWISEPDQGISDAMNKGINIAHGQLINHLHCGDQYMDNQIISQVVNSYTKDNWRWCFGNQVLIDELDKPVYLYTPPRYSQKLLQRINIIPHATVFSERLILKEVDGFSLSYRCAMDYHLWLRLSLLAEPKQLDFTLTKFLLGGRSSDIKLAFKEEIRAKNEILTLSLFDKSINWIIIKLRTLKRQFNITTFAKPL